MSAAMMAMSGYGAGGVVTPLTVANMVGSTASGTATAQVRFNADGTGTLTGTGVTTQTFNWYRPTTASIGSSYWIKMTPTSGTFSSGSATGTWVALSGAPSWTVSQGPSLGAKACTYSFQIAKDSAGTNVVGSGTGYVEADVG